MYHEFFSLTRPPFRITPDTSLFYSGAKRGAVLDALVYSVRSGEGIIKVVGEVGSGKTMLCRMLEVRLPRNIEIVYIANPSLSPENILQVIAFELKVVVDASVSKLEAMQKLQALLMRRHAEGKQVVVFIEEAQGMPLATLEEVRLLSNLETEESKLMQVVLFGQPELDQNLADNSIRQLRERITHSFHLDPLEPDEVCEYLNFRMWVSGYRGPDIFNLPMAKRIALYSQGMIRRINILADKTLLAAYADNTRTLAKKHVMVAAHDSQFLEMKESRGGWLMVLAVATIVGILVAGLTFAGLWWWNAERMNLQAEVGSAPPATATPVPEDTPAQVAVSVTPAPEPVAPEPAAPSGSADAAPVADLTPLVPTGQTDQPNSPPLASDVTETVQAVEVPEVDTADSGIGLQATDTQSQTAVEVAVLETSPVQESVVVVTAVAAKTASDTGGVLATPVRATPDTVETPVVQPVEASPILLASVSEQPDSALARYDDRLTDWLNTTRDHFVGSGGDGFSIQLLTVDLEYADKLADYLGKLPSDIDLDKVYVYETQIQGSTKLAVVYNQYNSLDRAREAVEALPQRLRRWQPFVRTVRSLKDEIAG